MYNISKAIVGFKELVGWKQPTSSFPFVLDAENKASTSGRFINDNQFVKLAYILATQDNKSITETQFNALLKEFYRTGLINMLDKVFDKPDFIDRQLLFKNPNNKQETEDFPNEAGFVGYQIKPDQYQNNYAFEITRTVLEFKNTGTLKLLLYNSAKNEPIQTKTVEVTSELEVVDLNWILDDTDGIYRGEYFFGYRFDGLALAPIEREYEQANIMSNITGMYVHSVYAPQALETELFDLEDVDNVSEHWGLNLDISVFKDYTDLLLRNKHIFSNALQQSIQVVVLESFKSTLRSNREQRISDDMMRDILVELNGINTQSYSEGGLKNALESEITRAKQEINKLKTGYYYDKYPSKVTRS